jgi:hypothetical protein
LWVRRPHAAWISPTRFTARDRRHDVLLSNRFGPDAPQTDALASKLAALANEFASDPG